MKDIDTIIKESEKSNRQAFIIISMLIILGFVFLNFIYSEMEKIQNKDSFGIDNNSYYERGNLKIIINHK